MLAVAVLVALLPLCFAQQDIQIFNNILFLNGQEYCIKGIDYNPTPLGISGMAPSGFGGGGYCSSHLDPSGFYKSACYDGDYADGGPDDAGTTTASNPPTSWFAPIWQRDFPNIIKMGFNTIRLYGANPTTYHVVKTYTNLFPGQGKDHTQFMQYAQDSNLKVIFPLYSDYGAFLSDSNTIFTRYLRWQIDEVGNYSSLIMWQLGNELGYTGNASHPGLYNDPTAMATYNLYADFARRYTYSKWGRFIPITTAIIDLPLTYDSLTVQYHVDILSLNIFRGNTFTTLFTGNNQYKGFNYSICATGKPIFISEFGMYPYTTGAVNAIWEAVVTSIQYGVVGAAYFEYIDEPFYNKSWGAYSVSIQYKGEANSNTSLDFIVDNITPKQQYYDLINGTYMGQPYNIPTNVFTLLGRDPTTPTTSTDRCAGSFMTCPGSGNGVFPWCNGNGACNRVTGACDCASGWGGSDCSQPSCPNNCNGNGQCNTLTTPPQCLCTANYFGSDCSQTVSSSACPNNCTNGNGVCSANTCSCHEGWAGADCAVIAISQPFSTTTTGTTSTATASTSTTATGSTTASTSSTATTASTSTGSTTATVSSTVAASTSTNSAVKFVPGLVLIFSAVATFFM